MSLDSRELSEDEIDAVAGGDTLFVLKNPRTQEVVFTKVIIGKSIDLQFPKKNPFIQLISL